jgi:multiple sugar transport system permease protein
MTAVAPPVPAAPAGKRRGARADRRRRIGEKWYTAYLFVLPHYILFVAMVILPFFFGAWIALHAWDWLGSFSGRPQPFVGLENFVTLFTPGSFHFSNFWNALWNTILFVLMSTPALIIMALFLATLLNSKFRGRGFFRAVYFAPWTLSVSVVSLLWFWLFQGIGPLSTVFSNAGMAAPPFLTENPFAWLTILVATLWWTIGFNTIILLAGMQQISPELYEAAAIDGASARQRFTHITIPSLRPILLLVITLQVIASFNLLGQAQIITNGGPPSERGGETTPIMLYIWDVGFGPRGRTEPGVASAMALIMAGLMLIVSVVNFRIFRTERA